MTDSIRGMQPVAGTDPTAGHRDYEITIERDGYADLEVAQMFNGIAETFDPTEAVEFTTKADPHHMNRLRVGDVLKMRVAVNT